MKEDIIKMIKRQLTLEGFKEVFTYMAVVPAIPMFAHIIGLTKFSQSTFDLMHDSLDIGLLGYFGIRAYEETVSFYKFLFKKKK